MTSPSETHPSASVGVLAAAWLKVSPAEVSIAKLAGDASTRIYYRARAADSSVIVVQYREPFDETERSVDRLAKAEHLNPSSRLTFSNDPCAQIELTHLLIDSSLPVPPVVVVSGADAVMLIEDVGDIRLQDWLPSKSEGDVEAAYRQALKLVVRIQEATEKALRADSISTHLAFDETKLKWELGFFFANYFNRYLHQRLEPSVSNAVQADFKSLCSDLAARSRVLTHRDYHARNLMMCRGEMYIIDYQDARLGPASYDVASLLSDPYTSLSREMAAE